MILNGLYGLALRVRHKLYDKGWKKRTAAAVPTICIGNVTAGGTGKTPHTEMLLRLLQESEEWKGKQLAVLSRGYKRTSKGFQQVVADGTAAFCGDEPMQVKRKFPGVVVAVDADRVEGCGFLTNPETLAGAKKARRTQHPEFPAADLILLDDAMQHRRLTPTATIALVDYGRQPADDRLLPYGRLRDLPERLRTADIILVTKCPAYLSQQDREECIARLGLGDAAPKVFFTTVTYDAPEGVFPEYDPRYIYSHRLILFSGIANDKPLRDYLSDTYKIVKRMVFPDHHRFSEADIRRISTLSSENPTAALATTEKDAQRLRDYGEMPPGLRERMFQVPIRAVFFSEQEREEFRKALLWLIK